MKRRDEPKKRRDEDRRDDEVEQSLRAIYQVENGDLPDLTKLERKRSHRWIWLTLGVSAVFLVLAAAAWTGFLYFQGLSGFVNEKLDLAIEGPEQITVGQEVTYFINYRNPLNEPLSNVELRINFPNDFSATKNLPEPSGAGLWRLGALAAEQSGTVTVRGKFTGALGTLSAVQAMAAYRSSGAAKDMQAIAAKNVTYSQSVLEGWIQVPEKAVPGDHIALLYHVKNTGRDTMEGLEARVGLPDGFTPDDKNLGQAKLEGRTYKLPLAPLAAASSTEISVVGVFASGFGGDAKVVGQTGILGQDGNFSMMQKSEAAFPVLAGDLSLKLVVNGSDQATRSLGFGDQLQTAIGFENTADEPLKNVKIQLAVETVALDQGQEVLDKFQLVDLAAAAKASSSTLEGRRLVWDAKAKSEFKEIAPHGLGELETLLAISPNATGTRPMAVRLTVIADMEVGKIKRSVQMAPMVFKLRSDARFSSQARFYTEEGAPIGSGPLPPKVGEPTTYRIVWSVDKKIHALKDMEAVAVLPRNARFVSLATSTAGALAYDADKREVKWALNRLPANVNGAEVEFDVELTPTLADDGRFAQLLGEATFQAQDEDINEPLMQSSKALTTDLQNDETAKGKGVVRKDVK